MTSLIDTCAVFGCGIKRRTRGLCPSHYQRWRRHGDPLAGGLPAGAGAKGAGLSRHSFGLMATHRINCGQNRGHASMTGLIAGGCYRTR